MNQSLQSGMTLIEIAVVMVLISVLTAVAIPTFDNWNSNQRVKGAARSVADSFQLARAEAMRTGNPQLVVLQFALGATSPIEIINDANADCTIDADEVLHRVSPVAGVSWGTTSSLANGTPAPDDPGVAVSNVSSGSSFSDATMLSTNPASWVLFQPDGLPRVFTPDLGAGTCTEIGQAGRGGGAIYMSNGERDYAVVLSHLGATRVHLWQETPGGWSQ